MEKTSGRRLRLAPSDFLLRKQCKSVLFCWQLGTAERLWFSPRCIFCGHSEAPTAALQVSACLARSRAALAQGEQSPAPSCWQWGLWRSSATSGAHFVKQLLRLVNALLEFTMTANLSNCRGVTRFLALLKNNVGVDVMYHSLGGR